MSVCDFDGTAAGVNDARNEAIETVENEATQTDWVGDLGGGLGSDSAASRGWFSAASGRSRPGCGPVDGGASSGLRSTAEVRAGSGADGVHAIRAAGAAVAEDTPDMPATVIAERVG